MADIWMPGLIRDPGELANYGRGRNRMEAVKVHYTVGVNSAPIGKRGFFQFLIPRSGVPTQFAPVDALNFDSGEWNDVGPGIEIEYYEPQDGPQPDNIATGSQLDWLGRIARWLNTEHGIPLSFYDSSQRVSEFAGWRGFITHRSLIQSVMHHDYITTEQWTRAVGLPGDQINWAAITEFARQRKAAQEAEPTMNAHVMFQGASHYFTRATDGRLAHIWYAGGKWNAEDVNAVAGQPGYRLAEGATIVARTKELHGTENQIEVGWTGSLGQPGHTWHNAPKWGTELLPVPK